MEDQSMEIMNNKKSFLFIIAAFIMAQPIGAMNLNWKKVAQHPATKYVALIAGLGIGGYFLYNYVTAENSQPFNSDTDNDININDNNDANIEDIDEDEIQAKLYEKNNVSSKTIVHEQDLINMQLVDAVKKNDQKAAQEAIKKGAHINEAKDTDRSKTPVLYCAVKHGFIEMVKLLIENGADLHITTLAGATPYQCALNSDRIDILELLLKKDNTKINQVNENDESTLLHNAVFSHNAQTVKLLLQYGANPNAMNALTQKPIELIQEEKQNSQEIKELLKNAIHLLKINTVVQNIDLLLMHKTRETINNPLINAQFQEIKQLGNEIASELNAIEEKIEISNKKNQALTHKLKDINKNLDKKEQNLMNHKPSPKVVISMEAVALFKKLSEGLDYYKQGGNLGEMNAFKQYLNKVAAEQPEMLKAAFTFKEKGKTLLEKANNNILLKQDFIQTYNRVQSKRSGL